MVAETQTFDEFMVTREAAARAYVRGDGDPLDDLVVRADPATFFCPGGDVVEGADAVATRYRHDAKSFLPDGTTHLEVLQSASSGDLGWWSGYQVASVHLQGEDAPMAMRLRVTETFRRVGGTWQLAHRHADQADPGH
jgi:ketosteroid isomerase-like protein